jgi:hypothetical protein
VIGCPVRCVDHPRRSPALEDERAPGVEPGRAHRAPVVALRQAPIGAEADLAAGGVEPLAQLSAVRRQASASAFAAGSPAVSPNSSRTTLASCALLRTWPSRLAECSAMSGRAARCASPRIALRRPSTLEYSARGRGRSARASERIERHAAPAPPPAAVETGQITGDPLAHLDRAPGEEVLARDLALERGERVGTGERLGRLAAARAQMRGKPLLVQRARIGGCSAAGPGAGMTPG